MKKVVILGSTGSIGTSTLEVIRRSAGSFRVVGLGAGKNIDRLARQVREFKPGWVVVKDEDRARLLQEKLGGKMAIGWGGEALERLAVLPEADIIVVAIPGITALLPTIAAVQERKIIALASKEVLVAAGPLVMSMARRSGSKLLPVDSEHSALFQCLRGEKIEQVSKIILTASGGPFLHTPLPELSGVLPAQALEHPRWKMGRKVSLDSATMMNKGLEVLEAHYLFGVDLERIQVVVHPQSIIHGMVQMRDGSVLAQLSQPNMCLPIQYALHYPDRPGQTYGEIDFFSLKPLSFFKPDWQKFPSLGLAYRAGRVGGTMPAVLNAANEVAGLAFLRGELAFNAIPMIIEGVMSIHTVTTQPELKAIMKADSWARTEAEKLIRHRESG